MLVTSRLGDVVQLGMLFLTALDPGEREQRPHYDAGIYPLQRRLEAETNAIWALDDFTPENGATRVAGASHKWEPSRRPLPHELEPVSMAAGTVLVYSGNLWHSAGANRTDRPRRALVCEYVLPWLRPADSHILTVPADRLRSMSPELLRLAGLAPASRYLGLIGGRHPDEWLRSTPLSPS
jgi:ectoine hydroxylase-related dioxygenase (phytanoyl-CoA dioxygenase family)